MAEHQRYSLVIHVADLTHEVLVRLPWDYALYGLDVDEQPNGKPARWPTWGVKVSTSPPHGEGRPVRTAVGLGLRCLATITGDWYRSSLGADTAGRRTIQVDTSEVPATHFDVDNRARLRLYENGRAAATAFLGRRH